MNDVVGLLPDGGVIAVPVVWFDGSWIVAVSVTPVPFGLTASIMAISGGHEPSLGSSQIAGHSPRWLGKRAVIRNMNGGLMPPAIVRVVATSETPAKPFPLDGDI